MKNKANVLSTDDILKLKAIVLYVVNKCGVIDIYHLLKIIYFADREHYAVWGTRLTKDTYIAMDNGPVASFLYDVLKVVMGKMTLAGDSNMDLITQSLCRADSDFNYYITARETADMDELAETDIQSLEKSIKENISANFDQLKTKSHDEAWELAYRKRKNSKMDSITMAKAGGASDDMLDYLKENEELDVALAF